MVHPSTSSNKRRQKRAAATQQQFNKNPSVAESTRIHIRQVLEDFRASNDDVYTFDANLSKFDRVEVHKLCIKMGFKSASSGSRKGNSRWVSIYKKKGKSNNNNVKKENNLTSFTFLEEGKVILQDFFSTYPPGDYEEGENASTSKNNNDNRGTKTDDMLCKPLIKTADIAKKLESVVARMQSDPKLKQITEDRAELPIATFKDVITSTIESHQVSLFTGVSHMLFFILFWL
ncbi:DExH-box ATP-dependent RNA helicase DExH6-like [Rutidosis leptorrhynchoides]|uniref:DExH-box ATP-dependent RNA helicase DExH6-like n=1 Tax=Rutidosis leptorrhynchoides TaxID=125765 RepID=UPI003A9908C5